MKKIMIAAAIVCAAAFSQAASVSWMSGALMTAANAAGGWSSTGVATAKADVTMQVFLLDNATDYAAVMDKTTLEILEWSKTQTAAATGHTYNSGTSAYAGAATASITGTANQQYYSVIVATYTDKTYGEMVMTAGATPKASSTGAANVTSIFGAPSGVKSWTAVPEPTSGLLLLLGMAGLALRRRRA